MKEYLVAEIIKFLSSPVNQAMLYLGVTAIAGTIFLELTLKAIDKATDAIHAIEAYHERKHSYNNK